MVRLDLDSEFDEEAEVAGHYIKSFVESAGEVSPVFERKLSDKLAHFGITDPAAGEWYRLGDVASAYREVAETVGSQTVRKAGVDTGKAVPMPDDDITVIESLEILQDAQVATETFRNSKKEAPAGEYLLERIDDTTVRFSATNAYPFPQPFLRGVVKGVVGDILGDDPVTLEEVDSEPGELAAWHVSWD